MDDFTVVMNDALMNEVLEVMADETIAKFEELTNKVKYQDYMMPWGKYQGHFVADVMLKDRVYFDWLLENVVDEEFKKALEFHKEAADENSDVC